MVCVTPDLPPIAHFYYVCRWSIVAASRKPTEHIYTFTHICNSLHFHRTECVRVCILDSLHVLQCTAFEPMNMVCHLFTSYCNAVFNSRLFSSHRAHSELMSNIEWAHEILYRFFRSVHIITWGCIFFSPHPRKRSTVWRRLCRVVDYWIEQITPAYITTYIELIRWRARVPSLTLPHNMPCPSQCRGLVARVVLCVFMENVFLLLFRYLSPSWLTMCDSFFYFFVSLPNRSRTLCRRCQYHIRWYYVICI